MDTALIHCALCGAEFTRFERGCGSCPLNSGCDLVRCPRCGYQFPRSSRWIEGGRRWIRWIQETISGGRAGRQGG